MARGSGRVVGIQHGLHRSLLGQLRPGDRRSDLLARSVGKIGNHQLGAIGIAFACDVFRKPLPGDALQLAEEVKFRLAVRVAPMLEEQALGEFVEQGRIA